MVQAVWCGGRPPGTQACSGGGSAGQRHAAGVVRCAGAGAQVAVQVARCAQAAGRCGSAAGRQSRQRMRSDLQTAVVSQAGRQVVAVAGSRKQVSQWWQVAVQEKVRWQAGGSVRVVQQVNAGGRQKRQESLMRAGRHG